MDEPNESLSLFVFFFFFSFFLSFFLSPLSHVTCISLRDVYNTSSFILYLATLSTLWSPVEPSENGTYYHIIIKQFA